MYGWNNYDITKYYLGELIADKATFNFGFGGISFLKDELATITSLILEFTFGILYLSATSLIIPLKIFVALLKPSSVKSPFSSKSVLLICLFFCILHI